MLGIGGPSKAELQEQIDELERTLENTRRELDRTSTQVGNNVEALDHMLSPSDDWREHERLNREKTGAVETLDEAHVAFKATRNCILAILIPKGEKVVHPESPTKVASPSQFGGGYGTATEKIYKKRISGGIVMAMTVPMSGEQKWVDSAMHASDFEYNLGAYVEPDEFDDDTRVECTNGIHVFATPKEAHTWLDRA